MSVRSRVADPATVTKGFGTSVPDLFRQGEEASLMTPASPFSPGTPIGPYDGYDRHTRQFNFTTGYNISTRPRLHEAVGFPVLTGLVDSYDVAQIVIWHRIDSIRSLDWKLVAADHYFGDVTEAIPLGLAALRKPDRKNSFKGWLAKYLYDILAWDAGTLFRLRNRAGRCIGLQPVDGRTIAPLLDYWGNSPDEPAEAYVQYVNGLPWNWLTRGDLIYEPFRPVTGSPYGRPPIESVILNANTDLRFQVYFLQRFTEGNLPAAFAASPDTWSPDQIEQFQGYWDAMMFGDQARKHQIRWMPGGSKIAWSNEKDFSDLFSMYLLRKTCAAYHVVPSDLGFTETVNRSSGESQADVQHRVGDLPLMEHVEGILSAFLQDDLGLPLKHEFDRGEEQVDQLAQAEADQKYMDRGVVGASEIREMRYGLTDAVPIPRVFFTERAGPIPLSSLEAVAGEIDPQTGAPEPGSPLPHTVFAETPGVQPNPPLYSQPLAEEIYGPSAIPAGTETQSTLPVAKESEAAAPAAGITADTGLYSYDLEDGDDDEPREAAVKSELAAFRRFERARRRSGEWRDFEFRVVERVCGHRLNDAGRLAVRKAAGEVAVAGLAVVAADTGRVLMLQRALCDDDPAAGTWEFPGGHIEQGETPLQGAWREWAEETGCVPPPGTQTGTWVSGIYQGIVWTVDAEASVPVRCDTAIANPDDPDGDMAEAIAWWNPSDLPGNPAVRAELQADIDVVMAALGCAPTDVGASSPGSNIEAASVGTCCGGPCCQDGGCCGGESGCECGPAAAPAEGDESVCPCGTPVVYDEMNGWQHADGSISHDDGESVSDKMGAVAKAAGARPKGPTLHLPTLTGIWGDIYARREKLLTKHARAVAAAWDACITELGSPREVVRQFRANAGKVAKLADPNAKRWQDAGTAAALAWLARLAKTKGYPALVAAIEDAIRSGMAEGEADALALAADRQGVAGFKIGRAFRAAYERLADDGDISRKAADAAESMISGAAGDVGRALADQTEGDGTEQDMTGAVDDTAAGNRSQSVGLGVDWHLFAGILGGALALYLRAASGEPAAAGPEQPPVPPPSPPPVLLDWITAGDDRVCPTCQGYEDNSPYAPDAVPAYPHPRCRCSVDLSASSGSSSFLGALLESFAN